MLIAREVDFTEASRLRTLRRPAAGSTEGSPAGALRGASACSVSNLASSGRLAKAAASALVGCTFCKVTTCAARSFL